MSKGDAPGPGSADPAGRNGPDGPMDPAEPTELEQDVLDAVDVDALLDALEPFIAINSSGGKETPAQEYMASLMEGLGLDVDVWELDLKALRKDPAYSEELRRKEALGVVGRFAGTGDGAAPADRPAPPDRLEPADRPGPAGSGAEAGEGSPSSHQGRTLVLNGHVDVVPAGEKDRWTVPPFEMTLKDNRVYGRGTADMKGGLLAGLFGLRAIADAGVSLAGSVLVQSVVGEEDGGLGTLAAVRRGHTGDGAMVLEPTRLVLAPAQAGAFNFRVTIPGRAAHGALRAEGVDPIDRFLPIYRALQALERKRNDRELQPRHPLFADQALPYALCVGTVRAGIWASTVAESLVFEGRLGIAPDEDPGVARWELESAIAEAHEAAAGSDAWLRDHPPVLEWWGGQFAPAATDPRDPIVTTTRDAFAAVVGDKPQIRGMPYGADMRLLANEGKTPTVLFGPGDVRRAHAPDEYVAIEELETAAKVVALTALRFCGG